MGHVTSSQRQLRPCRTPTVTMSLQISLQYSHVTQSTIAIAIAIPIAIPMRPLANGSVCLSKSYGRLASRLDRTLLPLGQSAGRVEVPDFGS